MKKLLVFFAFLSLNTVFTTYATAQFAINLGYHPAYFHHHRSHCSPPPPPLPPPPPVIHRGRHHTHRVWVPAHFEMTPNGRRHIRGHWARA